MHTERIGQNKIRRPKVKRSVASYAHYDYVLEVLNQVADGNFAFEVDLSRDRKDPVLLALAKMLDRLVLFSGEQVIGTAMLERSAKQMSKTAKSLRDMSDQFQVSVRGAVTSTTEMQQNMTTVSAAAEQLSVNMQSIAGAAQESNSNIESVKSSIMELTSASSEIAQNTGKATAISKEAMDNVTAAFRLVQELTAAAKDIDVVTSTISEISDQTKLLALNATIESARAGEAGKGFAVVAKEVKDLASQTNTATKDIQSKIEIIHGVTRRTAEAITTINTVMKSVNEAITTIAAAAEEQSVTTADIGRNVVSATERIKEMGTNVSEGALAVQDVSKSILGATNLAASVSDTLKAAGKLGEEMLQSSVTAYAETLEVTGASNDMARQLRPIQVPRKQRAEAEAVRPELVRFSADFDVLIDRMNDDHKQIFEYCNTMHQRIKNSVDVASLLPTFKELAAFTREHFDREEEAMAKASYDGLAEQKKAHGKILGIVSDIGKKMEAGEKVDFIEVLTMFRDWLVGHILGMDKRYGPVLVEAGVR